MCKWYHDEVRWGSLPAQLGKPVDRIVQSDLSIISPTSSTPESPTDSQDESLWAYLAWNFALRRVDAVSDQRHNAGFNWKSSSRNWQGDKLANHFQLLLQSIHEDNRKTLHPDCALPSSGRTGWFAMQISLLAVCLKQILFVEQLTDSWG
jgi:hypothetical protein